MSWIFKFLFCLFFFLILSISPNAIELSDRSTFREDFSSPAINANKWNMPTFELYNFKADPAMVSNANGINYLRLGKSESTMYPTGFIYAKEHFSYGSYSARIRVSDVPGAVASFFICTEISKIFSDGTHDEIDFEFITARPHSVLFTTWYLSSGTEGNKQTPTHNSFLWESPDFDIRKWHNYRFDWYEDHVDFFIDGIKRWTSTRAIPKRKMQIALHIYTIDTWDEVQFPPKGEILQMTDWIEYRAFK